MTTKGHRVLWLAEAAGVVVRVVVAAAPGVSSLALLSVGAGLEWGPGAGLMTAGVLVGADVVWTRAVGRPR